MSLDNLQMGLTIVVVLLQGWGAWNNARMQAAIADLKVYMHENFVHKEGY